MQCTMIALIIKYVNMFFVFSFMYFFITDNFIYYILYKCINLSNLQTKTAGGISRRSFISFFYNLQTL